MWQGMGCFELLLSFLVCFSAELFHSIIISNVLNLGGLSFLELCLKKKKCMYHFTTEKINTSNFLAAVSS